MQSGEGVVNADAFVVWLLDFLCVDAHVAVEVIAERHGSRPILVVDLVFEGQSQGEWTVLGVVVGLLVELFHAVDVGAVEEVGADARCPSACIAQHDVSLCGVGGIEVESAGAIARGIGVGVELCELPVFEQGLSSYAQ